MVGWLEGWLVWMGERCEREREWSRMNERMKQRSLPTTHRTLSRYTCVYEYDTALSMSN